MERNGPYQMVPRNDYQQYQDRTPQQDVKYPNHSGYPDMEMQVHFHVLQEKIRKMLWNNFRWESATKICNRCRKQTLIDQLVKLSLS